MKVVFTARKIKPGHFEAFRQAWQPERWPEGMVKAYLLRDPADRDQITAFGLFDVSDERAAALQREVEPSERERHERMAPHVAETITGGLYTVADSQSGSATGEHVVVPLTERRLKPGHRDAYVAAVRDFVAGMGGELPPGLTQVLALVDDADPYHRIQLGIVRTDDPVAMRDGSRSGRDRMLEAIAPHVESVGLDVSYEPVEELSPVHA
jgi:hypothetical protein